MVEKLFQSLVAVTAVAVIAATVAGGVAVQRYEFEQEYNAQRGDCMSFWNSSRHFELCYR